MSFVIVQICVNWIRGDAQPSARSCLLELERSRCQLSSTRELHQRRCGDNRRGNRRYYARPSAEGCRPYSNRHRSARGRATGHRQIYGPDTIPTQHHFSNARKDIRTAPHTSLCRSPGTRDCPHTDLVLSSHFTYRTIVVYVTQDTV